MPALSVSKRADVGLTPENPEATRTHTQVGTGKKGKLSTGVQKRLGVEARVAPGVVRTVREARVHRDTEGEILYSSKLGKLNALSART